MQTSGIQSAARVLFACVAAGAITQSLAAIPTTDVPHSKDNPIVTRFAGSTIAAYNEANYDEVALPLGPFQHSQFAKTLATQGHVTRIVYASPAGKTLAEVFANYRNALQASGFEILYSCLEGPADKGCGGYSFAERLSKPLLEHDDAHRNLVLDLIYSTNDDVRYLTAELKRGGGKVDIGLLVASNGRNPTGVLLQVIEDNQMATGQVTVDSAAMSKGLQNEGKIALYGLQFATDSADLRPQSDDTLKQMSELLHQQPKLKVYIVGHTDSSGTLEHNLTLSQRRAESVVKALAARFGIAAERLSAKGLASYSPVGSNQSDAGKAKNRRVEMVEQ